MKQSKFSLDIFSCVALLAIGATVWIFSEYYFSREFAVFTTEEEISEAVEMRFPHLAEFFFADYLL